MYYCTSVIVRKKPSSYGQDSTHSPQFVVFIAFDQFSDLGLRHNMIFIPIIFISNKNYLKLFVLVSFLEFISHYIQKENSLLGNPYVHIER